MRGAAGKWASEETRVPSAASALGAAQGRAAGPQREAQTLVHFRVTVLSLQPCGEGQVHLQPSGGSS